LRHSAIIAVIMIAAAFFVAVEADAASVRVMVQNSTKQEALAKYPVTISVGNKDIKDKYQSVRSMELRTDEDGAASGKIDTTRASLIRAEVVYRGVPYHSEFIKLSPGMESYTLDVPAYEITNDNSTVSVESRRMIIITKNDRSLEIYETLVVKNSGNMAYVGRFNDELDLNQVLFIPMPRSYMLYGFSGYETTKIRTNGSGVATQNEVIPGTNEINLHYYIQSDTGEFDLDLLSQKDAPEILNFTVFFPKENSWKLRQSGLKKAGEEFVNKIPYAVMKGTHGSIVKMKVFGPTYEGGFGLWHISIILAFVLTALSLFMARENIRTRMLVKEEERLQDLLGDVDQELQESGDDELTNSYAFFRQTLQRRLNTIEAYFKQD